MAAVLSKTRSILTRSTTKGDEDYARQWFIQVDPDDSSVEREVYVDIQTYLDLGEPDVITVTIEPGDTLN